MKKREIEGDFELNIASIIDCFTVLIVYLLLSASFITLGVLDVTVPTNSPAEATPEDSSAEKKLVVTIGVQRNNDIKVNTEGAETSSHVVPNKNGTKDFESLSAYLHGLKQHHPKADSAMIIGDDDIAYKEIVKTVEVTRVELPQVALSSDLMEQTLQ